MPPPPPRSGCEASPQLEGQPPERLPPPEGDAAVADFYAAHNRELVHLMGGDERFAWAEGTS